MIDALPLLLAPEGYQISRSVRLRSSASAYLNKTNSSSPTDSRKWTWSGWVKRGVLGVEQKLIAQCNSGSDDSYLQFNANNGLVIGSYSGAGTDYGITTSAVFRDPSAWYHVVAVLDTANATAADRAILYVNGVRQAVANAANGMWPLNSTNNKINTASQVVNIGRRPTFNDSPFDGYLTEVNFIDGQALTPSSFGETNPITGVWQPKKYTGTYGTNGFYLNFSENSAATAAAIGKDYSGNGNNWTPNNISVTAGATYDSMLDVPTPWADGGNGRGNYAVVSILDVDRANITTSNGNLTNVKATASDSPRVVASMGATTGKWYAEITWSSITNSAPNANYLVTGVTTKELWSSTSNGFNVVAYFAANAPGAAIAGYKQITTAGSAVNSAYGSNYFTAGAVIGIALDLDAGTVTFYNNNVSQGAITLPTTSQEWFVFCTSDGTSNGYTNHFNFGQSPFAYTPPTGFKALNTQNLPEPVIKKGNQYFDATTYTGTNATQTITNSGGFQPDLVWGKSRTNIRNNNLYDSVRGAGNMLISNATNAELTGGELTAFVANGFTLGANVYQMNASGDSLVAWQWKEGPTQGFDIVTYTGNGTNPGRTVAHNLGVAPAMIITKARSAVAEWPCYHKSLPISNTLYLNATYASSTYLNRFSAVSSTDFTTGSSGSELNTNGVTYVAYLFAEVAGFSKFGSYTGNGSADGPFVFCGFRPRYVMVKRTDTAADWYVVDTARSTSNGNNVVDQKLYPNLSVAENGGSGETTSTNNFDIISNGFKCRTLNGNTNASGGTYIFAAFAEVPFRNALAR